MMQPSPSRGFVAQENCIPNFELDNRLEARFQCPICLECLKDPLLTSCGHRFCEKCINDWLSQDGKGRTCPVDGQELNVPKDLFPDNFTRREISDLEENSPQNSVEKGGEEASCQILNCPFQDVGCLEKLPAKKLSPHLESHLHSHLNLLTSAYSKLKLSIHDQHVVNKSHEANFWEPNTKSGQEENGVVDSRPPWEGLLRSLYERIVVLEQKNHEQEIQLQNYKRQLSAVSVSTNTSFERLSQELQLRHCNGTLIWTISPIVEKLERMLSSPNMFMEYSPSFYTSPCGYRFCARLNVSPRESDHLALLIHLKKGENDQYLNWPFSGRISFTLINHLYPHLHLHETMMSRPELDAFKKPIGELNPRGFGYTEFISICDLRQQGFISDNKIVIKIQILCV